LALRFTNKALRDEDVWRSAGTVGGECSGSRPGRFIPGERVLDGPRDGVDDVEGSKTASTAVQLTASRYPASLAATSSDRNVRG
jgi:hypothetical protein